MKSRRATIEEPADAEKGASLRTNCVSRFRKTVAPRSKLKTVKPGGYEERGREKEWGRKKEGRGKQGMARDAHAK